MEKHINAFHLLNSLPHVLVVFSDALKVHGIVLCRAVPCHAVFCYIASC